MTTKSVKELIKLEKEIKAYDNGMFLTVNYPVTIHGHDSKTGRQTSKEEYRFKLVLRNDMFKRVKHWVFNDTRYKADAIAKEFTMAQVAECRKYWLQVRNKPLPDPEWKEW